VVGPVPGVRELELLSFRAPGCLPGVVGSGMSSREGRGTGREKGASEGTERIVLDTSLFVNPDVRGVLGATPTEALENFLSLASRAPHLRFYMPPSVFEELMNFVQRDRLPPELLVHLRQKPPSRYEMTTPAVFLYELIEDIRGRVNKGLRIAEKAVRSMGVSGPDEAIQDLRRKYREALREGIIDSREDVDLILLAKELDALLVTADQGALKWADKLGVRWLFPEKFKDYLLASVEKAGP
jgi:RNA ligase partner protein